MPARSSLHELAISTVYAIPLRAGDDLLGVIYLDRRSVQDQAPRAELALVESLAAYATVAVCNARMNGELSRRVQKLQVINDISLAISATLKVERLLSLILQHVLVLSGAEQGYILLGDGSELECLASLGTDGHPVSDVTFSRSIATRAITENRPICILDTHDDAVERSASIVALDLRSVICVPLLANQQRLGVLYVSSRVITKTFTPQDQSLLEAIANQAALAIRNAQLLDEQEQQIVELERALVLVKEAQTKAVTDGLTGLYNHVFFKEQLYNSVIEAERYGQPLSLIMIDLDHFKRINDRFGHQTGDQVLRQAASALRPLVRECDVLARYGGEEVAVLLPQTSLPGAHVVAERIREGLAELDVWSPEGEPVPVTASLGVAAHRPGLTATELLERADKALYSAKHGGRNRVCVHGQTVQLNTSELAELRQAQQESYLNTVTALSATVAAKGQGRLDDSQRLKDLVRKLSLALGLSEHQTREIELATILRDVGKIGVPDAILLKPGPLDPHEWELMRSHPAQGARIVQAGNLPGMAQAIRHHHERWDGKGYPDGLSGEDIPLTARIVSVLDAYWAMTHDRPYGGAKSHDEVLAILKDSAGSQFDPRVIEHFLGLDFGESPQSA